MRPPRLIGNTGEQGEFVLPLNVPTTDGKTLKTRRLHVRGRVVDADRARGAARPRDAVRRRCVETGVSTARALFSFNSTNVEGWGLYAERIVQPFMPPDGQLISLQHRLMRAARAYPRSRAAAGHDHARAGAARC